MIFSVITCIKCLASFMHRYPFNRFFIKINIKMCFSLLIDFCKGSLYLRYMIRTLYLKSLVHSSKTCHCPACNINTFFLFTFFLQMKTFSLLKGVLCNILIDVFMGCGCFISAIFYLRCLIMFKRWWLC